MLAPSAVLCRAQDAPDRKAVPTGFFTGQVVNGPKLDAHKRWVFVQGAKGVSRKVDVASAKVIYDEDVPQNEREAKPEDGVREGARIRVTAVQHDGDWKATTVEILKAAEK